MSDSMHDAKATDGSLCEKDIQAGSSEEIQIDPIAEKKVVACCVSPKAVY